MDLVTLVVAMGIVGFLHGPCDIALFTLRQRRTDPAWTGRAFTVSMSINFLGIPVGSAAAGAIAAYSLSGELVFAAAMCVLAAVLARVMIPMGAVDR